MTRDATELADGPVGGQKSSPLIGARTARTAWNITFMMMLFQTINYADKAVLGIVAQPLAEDLGLSHSEVGMLGSAFYMLFSITGLIGGFIADRVKIVWMLVGMVVLWSVLQIPILLIGTFGALLVSRILLGAAEGPAASLYTVTVFGWFPKDKRALPVSIVTCGGALAKLVLAPVLTILAATFGWKAAFVTLMVAGLVWVVAWLAVGKDGPYSVNSARERAKESNNTGSVERVKFWRIAVLPTFWGGLIGMFAVYSLVSVILTWLPSYFEQGLGFSRLHSGFLFALPSVVGLPAMLLSSALSDRLARRGTSVRLARGVLSATALLVCGAMLGAMPYVHNAWATVIILSLGYAIGTATLPLMQLVVGHICPERQIASTLGVFIALFQTAGLLAPWLTGHIVDAAPTNAAGYATAFQIVGIATVIGALLIILAVNPERDRARIATIDPLTHADGAFDDAALLSGATENSTPPERKPA